jgi:hypothetical protein
LIQQSTSIELQRSTACAKALNALGFNAMNEQAWSQSAEENGGFEAAATRYLQKAL